MFTMCDTLQGQLLEHKVTFCVDYPQAASPLWLAFVLANSVCLLWASFWFFNANFLLLLYICFTICSVISYIIFLCNRGDHHTTLLCYVKEHLYKMRFCDLPICCILILIVIFNKWQFTLTSFYVFYLEKEGGYKIRT